MRHWLILARPFTLLTPALGVTVGGIAAIENGFVGRDSGISAWLAIAMGAMAAALLNAASNALNQICDISIDRVAKPKRPIPMGRISIRAAWAFVAIVGICAIALAGAASAYPLGTSVIYLVAASLTWAYSAPPLRLRRFPWLSNLTIAIPRGLLLAPAGWSLLAPLDVADPWLIGAVPAMFLVGAASTKDFADMEADQANGVVTLPILLGPSRATRIMWPFLWLPFLGLAAVSFFAVKGIRSDVQFLLGLALAVWGWRIGRMLVRDPEAMTNTENHPSWRHMYGLMLCYYAGIWVSYSLGGP